MLVPPSPRHRTRVNANDLILLRPVNNDYPRLAPMEVSGAHNADPQFKRAFNRDDGPFTPRTPVASPNYPSHDSSHRRVSRVPSLNLDVHQLASATHTPRACRTRCPDAPRLIYNGETPRSKTESSIFRTHPSMDLVLFSPRPPSLEIAGPILTSRRQGRAASNEPAKPAKRHSTPAQDEGWLSARLDAMAATASASAAETQAALGAATRRLDEVLRRLGSDEA